MGKGGEEGRRGGKDVRRLGGRLSRRGCGIFASFLGVGFDDYFGGFWGGGKVMIRKIEWKTGGVERARGRVGWRGGERRAESGMKMRGCTNTIRTVMAGWRKMLSDNGI